MCPHGSARAATTPWAAVWTEHPEVLSNEQLEEQACEKRVLPGWAMDAPLPSFSRSQATSYPAWAPQAGGLSPAALQAAHASVRDPGPPQSGLPSKGTCFFTTPPPSLAFITCLWETLRLI